jgi:hypothetical protein
MDFLGRWQSTIRPSSNWTARMNRHPLLKIRADNVDCGAKTRLCLESSLVFRIIKSHGEKVGAGNSTFQIVLGNVRLDGSYFGRRNQRSFILEYGCFVKPEFECQAGCVVAKTDCDNWIGRGLALSELTI